MLLFAHHSKLMKQNYEKYELVGFIIWMTFFCSEGKFSTHKKNIGTEDME